MRPPLLHATRSGCDDECSKEETEFRIVEAGLGMSLGSSETWISCEAYRANRTSAYPSIRMNDPLAVRIYEALTAFRAGSSSEWVPIR